MATASQSETWKIFIGCDDASRDKTYNVPSSTTLEEIKRRWTEDIGIPSSAAVLMNIDGEVLDSKRQLQDVGESFHGKKIVNLLAEEVVDLSIEVYRDVSDRRQISLRLSWSPEEIETMVRTLFALTQQRRLRLRTLTGPLQPHVSLRQQALSRDTLLVVELSVEVALTDAWSGRVTNIELFSCDSCDDLMDASAGRPQRLLCDGRMVDTGNTLVDALQPFGGLERPHFSLSLEVMHDLTVLINGRFFDCFVWPSNRLSEILPELPAMTLPLFAGERLPRSGRLRDLDLPDCSLLMGPARAVRVRLSSGKCRVVRVPDAGTVADLERAVEKEEAQPFVLRRGSRELGSEEEVSRVVDGDSDLVEVDRRSLTLAVSLYDRSVRLQTCRRSLRFSDVMALVAGRSGVRLDRLLGRTLSCAGCGRRVSRAEEVFQAIPAPCCSVQSLRLEEPMPPAKSASGTQTQCEWRQAATSRTVDRGCQATAFWHQMGTQTESSTESVGSQTSVHQSSFCQQQPPPPPATAWPFYIWDLTSGPARPVQCDLTLSEPITVASVSREVSKAVEADPGRVKLLRCFGMTKDHEFVLVCDSSDRYVNPLASNAEYGDENGTIVKLSRVQYDKRALDNVDAEFVVVPGRRNTVDIVKR